MKNFRDSKQAVSSVMGVILMAGLTVVLVGTVAMSVLAYTVPSDAPDAKIMIRQARGNLNSFTGNEIVLGHKGGNKLLPENVKIMIYSEGKEALKDGGSISGAPLKEIIVTYTDLEGYNYVNNQGQRKDRWMYNLSPGDDSHIEEAKIVLNDVWEPGEKVVLFGADGANPYNNNSVDKKYELYPGSKITVEIIDIPTNKIISTSSATVKFSNEVMGY